MTDGITLPSGVEVYEGPVLITPGIGTIVPEGDLTPGEVQALRDDVAAVMDLELGDLSNVDTTGDEGTALIKGEDGQFVFGTISGSISRIGNAGTDDNAYDVEYISLRNGLRFRPSSPGTVFLEAITGTSSGTLAEGDHMHYQAEPQRVTTGPSGYMSGGTQSLGSTSVTLANGNRYVVEAEVYGQLRGADPGAAYYTLEINIGGNTYESHGGTGGFWCVQGVPDKINWKHARRMTGTGAAVSVSANVKFHSGSGFNVDRTYLEVRLRPER